MRSLKWRAFRTQVYILYMYHRPGGYITGSRESSDCILLCIRIYVVMNFHIHTCGCSVCLYKFVYIYLYISLRVRSGFNTCARVSSDCEIAACSIYKYSGIRFWIQEGLRDVYCACEFIMRSRITRARVAVVWSQRRETYICRFSVSLFDCFARLTQFIFTRSSKFQDTLGSPQGDW